MQTLTHYLGGILHRQFRPKGDQELSLFREGLKTHLGWSWVETKICEAAFHTLVLHGWCWLLTTKTHLQYLRVPEVPSNWLSEACLTSFPSLEIHCVGRTLRMCSSCRLILKKWRNRHLCKICKFWYYTNSLHIMYIYIIYLFLYIYIYICKKICWYTHWNTLLETERYCWWKKSCTSWGW